MTWSIRIIFLLGIISVLLSAGFYRSYKNSISTPTILPSTHFANVLKKTNLKPDISLKTLSLQSAAIMGDVGHTQLVLRLSAVPLYAIQTDDTHQIITLKLDNIDPQFSLPPLDTQGTAIQQINFNVTPDNQLLLTLTILAGTDVQRLKLDGNNMVLDIGLSKDIPYVNSPAINATSSLHSQPVEPLVKTVVPLTSDELAAQNYNEAMDLLSQGNKEGAIGLLQMLVTEHPNYLVGRTALADLLLAQNKSKDSLIILKSIHPTPLLDENPDNIEYYNLLAESYRQSGDNLAALKLYQALLNNNNTNGSWWIGLGMCFDALHQSQAAQEAYQKAQETQNLTPVLESFLVQKLKLN